MDYYSDGYCRFGCCYGYDEDGEEHSVKTARPQVFIEDDEIQIDTVQHELQRHQNGNQVSSGEESEDADEEQGGAEQQQVMEWDFAHLVLLVGLIAITIQPIMAAKRSTLTNSKGKA